MSGSASTTPDSDLCAGGCGNARAVIGSGAFTVRIRYCRSCSEQLAERDAVSEAGASSEDHPRQLLSLEADLGPALASRTLEGFPAHGGRGEAIAKAATWLEGCLAGDKTNLYLCGAVGEGKTGLGAALARQFASSGKIARFYVGRDWLDAIRRASFQDGGVDHEERARGASLLVLDDLGTERSTPFALERLLSLVDHRYRQELPTIVTSNFTPAELIEEIGRTDPVIGERIVSRLVEDAVKVRFDFGSLRIESLAA